MDYKDLQETLNALLGKKLTDINLVCEMLCFDFEKGNSIHSLCLTRVIKNNDLLFTTLDYQNWDEKIDTNNDAWYYLEKYKNDVLGGKVNHVNVTPLNDLILQLDNQITLEFFISNGYFHYGKNNEQWRFINTEEKHAIVYSKTIELGEPTL